MFILSLLADSRAYSVTIRQSHYGAALTSGRSAVNGSETSHLRRHALHQLEMTSEYYEMTLPSPRIPRPPAMTVGTIEVPATAPVKMRAAPVVTIGNTTENLFLNEKGYGITCDTYLHGSYFYISRMG